MRRLELFAIDALTTNMIPNTILPKRAAQRLAAIALLVASALTASAATVHWNAPQNISGDTDVSTVGALVQASNLYAENNTGVEGDTTINGVLFSGWDPTLTNPSGKFVVNYGVSGTFNGYDANKSGDPNTQIGQMSSAYQALLRSGTFGNGASQLSITIQNLTVGRRYQVQFWFNDSRGTYGTNGTQGTTVTAGNSVQVLGDVTGQVGGTGQYVIGTFVADAATQDFLIQGDAATLLNALMLRDITAAGPSYDANDDFSSTANDSSRAWQYGYTNTDGTGFFDDPTETTDTDGNGNALRSVWRYTPADMAVVHNDTGQNQTYNSCTMQPGDVLAMFPGNDGRKTVVRWTAPASGQYLVQGKFEDIDLTSSDVAVVKNGDTANPLYSNEITDNTCQGTAVIEPFSFNVTVNAGDTLDFRVGLGTDGNYSYDGTGFTVNIQSVNVNPVGNNNFETPNLNGLAYEYNPTTSTAQPWTFSGTSGIAVSSDGDFEASGTTTGQFAFIQLSDGDQNGAVAQTIHFDASGLYTLQYDEAGRITNGDLTYVVQVFDTNNNNVLYVQPSTTSGEAFTTRQLQFNVPAAGDYSLQFSAVAHASNGTDDTAFFDNVNISPSSLAPGCVAPPAGLLAWFRAENDLKDATGVYDATAANVTFTNGEVGKAFSFDYNNGGSYVSVPDTNGAFDLSDITIDAWVKRDATTNQAQVIAIKAASDASAVSFIFYVEPNSGALVWQTNVGSGVYPGPLLPDDSAWHFVAASYNSQTTKLTLYVDGVESITTSVQAGSSTSGEAVEIGGSTAVYNNFGSWAEFPGEIDELEIFNRALSTAELQSIYQSNSSGKCYLPGAPSTPDLMDGSDSGESPSDDYTNVSSPSFYIAGVTNGASVDLLRDGNVVATATASGSTITLSDASVPEGKHTYTAQETLDARTSNVSGSLDVTFDYTAPGAPSAPDLKAASDTGSSNNDNLTKATSLSFDIANTDTDATVYLYRGNVLAGFGVGTATGVTIVDTGAAPDGDYVYTSKVQDRAGNATNSASSLTVTVDRTAPVVTVPTDITVEATGPNGAAVTFSPSATDAHAFTLVASPTSGSTFAIGTTAVTATATDAAGNAAAKNFNVTVRDTTAPVITVPASTTVEATGPNGAAVTFSASASDIVDGSDAVSCVPASGSTFALGTTAVTCSSTDAHGNHASKQFNVTVHDTTPPAITNVPADITTTATSSNGAAVDYTTPTATDTVSGNVPVNCSPASGSTFPVGTTTVTCTAKDAANNSSQASFKVTVQQPQSTPTATPTATATPSASPSQAVNLSTRADVLTGENVMIGGFIITGNAPKTVVVRAIGPSTAIAGALADPELELHGPGDFAPISNDNWQDSFNANDIPTVLQPHDPRESAILVTLSPGAYTGIVRGKSNATGIALVEVYDISTGVPSQLANISTRSFVQTQDNVMIGGFILSGADGSTSNVIVRAIGPSLADEGIANPLADPVLEVHNKDGSLVVTNDNWQDDANASKVSDAGVPPKSNLEAALYLSLPAGEYTAIVSGKGGTGVGLVEVYHVQ